MQTVQRKLVKQGRNALTTTLPSPWIKKKGLQQGDTVQIIIDGELLQISAATKVPKKRTEVDVTDTPRSFICHVVYGRYIEGVDELTVHHSNPSLIQELATQCPGMMMESHSIDRTILRSIVSVPEENFDVVFRRASFVLLQQAQTLQAIAAGKATYQDLKTIERLLDQNIMYCLRYINKYAKTEHSHRDFLLCTTLEHASDLISVIAKYIDKDKKVAVWVHSMMVNYVESLSNKDLKTVYSKLRKTRDVLQKKTFVDGIAYSLVETLYNYIGYIIQQE